jgi:hypothetical protein
MSNIEEVATTTIKENDENVDTSVLNENETKSADTTAKSSKDNKKSKYLQL